MALPFALRTRIALDEPARRPTRRVRLPRIVGPIAFYWGAMAALAYGVQSGALPLGDWLWPDRPPTGTEASEPRWDDPREPPAAPPPTDSVPAGEQPAATAPLAVALAPAPEPAREDAAPSAPIVTLELPAPRRQVLALSPPEPAPADAALEPAPRRALRPLAIPPAEPPRLDARGATNGDAHGRVSSRAEELAPRDRWTEPTFGAAPATAQLGRVALRTPDSTRGARHIDDTYLFPELEGPGAARPALTARALLPGVDPGAPAPGARLEPAPTTRPRPGGAVGTCEAAAAAASEVVDLTTRGAGTPDVTRDAYARLLDDGRYLAGCRIPGSLRFEICVAVKDGRAVGVTVTTSPPSAGIAACIRSAVARLSFPVSPRLDVTRTRFDAAR